MPNPRDDDQRNDRGSVMVVAALAMVALLLFAALAIDVGFAWSSRTQSQNVSDSAALAAAGTMIQQVGTNAATVELDAAMAAGQSYAAGNSTVANASAVVRAAQKPNGDFEFGWWDLPTRTLKTTGVDLTNPNEVTGVRVDVLMDSAGDTNKRSPTFLSQFLGRDGFDVKNTAVAYMGFEGGWEPGEFDLPIGIDSCKIAAHSGSGPGCDDPRCGCGFCTTIATPPNPDLLHWHQGPEPVTKLEFASTGDQNACWTVYDGSSPSINNPDLQDVVDDGNSQGLESGDDAYFDNGTKNATIAYIRDRFYGCNNAGKDCGNHSPMGEDRYSPNPAGSPGSAPAIDSWVVKLPVFECKPGVHCAGGDTMEIIGGVCFQIREVLASGGDYTVSDHEIRGRLLCRDSTDPEERILFDTYCKDTSTGSTPGGCNFGFHAQSPVLVE